jgi:hypothetical protein
VMHKKIVDGENVYVEGAIEREGLLYRTSYLVLPRTLLNEMPLEWQEKFMALMEDMENSWKWYEIRNQYMVKLRVNGQFAKDPLSDYRHPNQAYIDSVRTEEHPHD